MQMFEYVQRRLKNVPPNDVAQIAVDTEVNIATLANIRYGKINDAASKTVQKLFEYFGGKVGGMK